MSDHTTIAASCAMISVDTRKPCGKPAPWKVKGRRKMERWCDEHATMLRAWGREMIRAKPLNDGTQRPGDAEATNATRATPPGSLK